MNKPACLATDCHTLCDSPSGTLSHCLEHSGEDTSGNRSDAVANVEGSRGGGPSRRGGRGLVLGIRLGGRRGSRAGALLRVAAVLHLSWIQGAAVVLDVGLALVLGPRAGRVGGNAVRVGLLADELGEELAAPPTLRPNGSISAG